MSDRQYAEAHHIKPLGESHNGPDIAENIICVCPNHHVLLDYGAIKLSRDQIRMEEGHNISDEFIEYHNEFIVKCQPTEKSPKLVPIESGKIRMNLLRTGRVAIKETHAIFEK